MHAPAAILDIDGTLVDTNYHHAVAWYRAFRQHGFVLPAWQIHRHIGMGGDQLVADLIGEGADEEQGDSIRQAETALYMALIEEVEPLSEARELIVDLKERGLPVVLASSARPAEVDHYLDLLDARRIADAWTSSGDVTSTKPQPDLIAAALEKIDAEEGVLVGDSTWDCVAAQRAGVPSIAVRTGGFGADELAEAGAAAVFESIAELRSRLPETPFG